MGTGLNSAISAPSDTTLAEVRQRIDASPGGTPSVILTPPRVRAWRDAITNNPACAAVARQIETRATALLKAPVCERKLEGRRLLGVSDEANRRITILAMAWYQTEDPRFARRAADELRAISAFSDWNPSHFLDTAILSMAAGIGYDTFGGQLDADLRQQVREALVNKGLRASLVIRENGTPMGWVSTRNNWNQVCHGGLVVGALALRHDEPELAAEIVHRAVVNVPRAVAVCEPDGAYPEGPGYWEFGTSFNVFLIEALESALGTDFGLAGLPGLRASAVFMVHATGPTGLTFNFADGNAGQRNSPTLYWFARRFGVPALLVSAPENAIWEGHPEQFGHGEMALLSPLWRVSYLPPEAPPAALPLDAVFRGPAPLAIFRSRWSDPNALYLAVKAGTPGANHGHMDAGCFVFEAQGVRWACDLGAENYFRAESTGLSFWDAKQTGDRWRFFRQGALSHNIVTIDGAQQCVDGSARITAFSGDALTPSATVDLTSLYAGQAAAVERTFTMPQRRQVVVADRLTGLKAGSRVRWAMVTPAQGAAEGGTMTLRHGAKQVRLTVAGVAPVTWQVSDLATPAHDFDAPNPGFRQISFEVTAPESGLLAWQVSLTPEGAP